MSEVNYQWKSKAISHVGKVRQINEDSVLDKPQQGLWVVADGMGGHEAGDVASQAIVNTLDQLAPRAYISDYIDLVEDTLVKINGELIEYAQKKMNGLTVGSTAVCMISRGTLGVVLWVGDSRLYRYRNNELVQLTKDHSEVQRLVDEGVITPEQAENSAFKNVLTRAIGAHEVVDVDINAFDVALGDRYLICSDGLYNELTDEQIFAVIKDKPIEQMAEVFQNQVLTTPARDNFSFIVIEPE